MLATDDIFREWMAYQDHGDVRESVVGLADVVEPGFVDEYFLQDESGHRLGQLRSGLHDP